jgi:hypothetical protein
MTKQTFKYSCQRRGCPDYNHEFEIHATPQEARNLRGCTKDCAGCGNKVRLRSISVTDKAAERIEAVRRGPTQRHIFTYVCLAHGCRQHLRAVTSVVAPRDLVREMTKVYKCVDCKMPQHLRNIVPLDPASELAKELDKIGVAL